MLSLICKLNGSNIIFFRRDFSTLETEYENVFVDPSKSILFTIEMFKKLYFSIFDRSVKNKNAMEHTLQRVSVNWKSIENYTRFANR